jgi:cytochrome c oxidase cbb3-type subunit 1
MPFYLVRFIGGVFVVTGMFIMAYNCWRTIKGDSLHEPEFESEAQPA